MGTDLWCGTEGSIRTDLYEALSQTMLEDFGRDLEKFLNTFNARYRELHNVSEEAMTMDRCIRWLLKNLGEVGGPNGYLREQVNEIYTLLSAESELVTPGSDFVAAYLLDGDPPTLVQAVPAKPPVYRSKVTWQRVHSARGVRINAVFGYIVSH